MLPSDEGNETSKTGWIMWEGLTWGTMWMFGFSIDSSELSDDVKLVELLKSSTSSSQWSSS